MTLFPVNNARQGHLFTQLLPCKTITLCSEANILCRFTYAQHRDSLTGDIGPAAQILQAICFAVILCYHAQARWAAVHGVELFIMRKFGHCYSLSFTSINTGLSFSSRLLASFSSSIFFSGYFGVEFLNLFEFT